MRLEPRSEFSVTFALSAPIAALALSFVICAVLVQWSGASAIATFGLVVKGAVGSKFALLETLTRSTPLIFTGLAAAVAFRAKLWNIGGEGQFYIGAVVTVVLGAGILPLPAPILVPVLLAAGALGGGLTLLGPAFLKIRFGVDEVVTTLLLNFVVLLLVSLLLEGPLRDPMGLGWPQSAKVVAEARLPKLIPGMRLHLGFIVGLITAIAVWVIVARTALGYEMRAVGHNLRAARFFGIPVDGVILKTALISGGLAGLAGVIEVTGLKGNLIRELSPGFGYSGIVVAMLASLHPVAVIATAIFVAAVFVGADAMSRSAVVPSYIAHVMVAVSLLTMVVAVMFTRFRLRWQ